MDLSLPLRFLSLRQTLVRRTCGWVVGLASTLVVVFGVLRPRPACGCLTKPRVAATEGLRRPAAAEEFERRHAAARATARRCGRPA
ncbi:hypothetical protein SAMN02745121_03987 [Nannocystis exedens]|uniref:Uncharacterized protein n=1 Tax=Nannocystis exedens TaxID=54 RepID=A0A1I1ZYX9_9BACT|nr:hypothetical protein [Nannocystis exedens]PCC75290.1 hypothetical protein NAEX_08399 [Nannocystis exedens]SFE35670.1 hypothetical protein SAMN02745121_03987 [Nannocystis exedens]